jgi:hydrogenase nickel incorporation protein HypB
VAIITKMDIAEAVEFDLDKARKSIQSVRPGMKIFELSAKTDIGMHEWIKWLEEKIGDSKLTSAFEN